MPHQMLLTPRQLHPFSAANFLSPPLTPFPFSHSLSFSFRPTNQKNPLCSPHQTCIAQLSQEPTTTAMMAPSQPPMAEGPVELPPSVPPIVATPDEPRPLQIATSVLITGAITAFLFRSLRRRAKRASETRFRSYGEKESVTEEAVGSFKSMASSPGAVESPPSPVQAFLGAVLAGVIAINLFKFTTNVEAALNRQTISDNYSAVVVYRITITIRTMISGLFYLATFLFGANSLGLFLYSGQLFLSSFMEDSSSEYESEASPSSSKSESDDQSSDISM
ncbi:hypothetical protein OROMI_019874 [Orobanche minor]